MSTAESAGQPAKTRTLVKKVVMLGDYAVGKTSMVERFVYDRYSSLYQASIGMVARRKKVLLPDEAGGTEITMVLWDIAGSQRLVDNPMRRNYLLGSNGALLVVDLTRRESLDNIEAYAADLARENVDARIVLAGNKCDLEEEIEVEEEAIIKVADRIDARYIRTSAKTEEGVEEAFLAMAEMLAATS